mgnify:FL=1
MTFDLHDEALLFSRLTGLQPVADIERAMQIGAAIGAAQVLRLERRRLERLHAGNLNEKLTING